MAAGPETTTSEDKPGNGADGATRSRAKSGRKAVWLAVAVALIWLFIGSAVGPLAGKLSEVQKNDNTSFLPTSAESTKVAKEQAAFADVNSLPILVVVSSKDNAALTPQQVGEAGQLAQEIPTLQVEGGGQLSEYLLPGPVIPIPSEDGQAVLLLVNLDGEKATANLPSGEPLLPAAVNSIREAASGYTDVLVNVAGPGGILADLFKVFGGIDTTLLGVTAIVVAVILILVYRSPFIWLIPLLSSGMALATASAVVYALAKNDIVVLNGQSQGILTVLVFGAGTDYALLLVARYREELHKFDSHTQAMRAALRGVVEPIVASAATVCLGLMCLLLSELNSNRSLGPVSAAGIVAALVVMLTFLPALLVIPSVVIPILAFIVPALVGAVLAALTDIPAGPFVAFGGVLALASIVAWIFFGVMRVRKPEWGPFSRTKFPPGRWAFWPRVPHYGAEDEKWSGTWSKVARGVGNHRRVVWIATALVMLVFAAFTTTLKADGITTTQAFTQRTDAVIGQEEIAQHFPGGLGTPVVILANEGAYQQVLSAAQSSPGIASVAPYTGSALTGPPVPGAPPKVVNGRVQLQATLSDAPDSAAGEQAVVTLRDNLHAVPGADALVGGQTAAQVDVNEASVHDRDLIIPVVLAVIFIVLVILLRALLAPLLLIATVLLSYFATLGLCAIFFNDVFKFPGADVSFPLFAFVFLVALGVDYNIFLMTRVREESRKHGTRPGILRGLAVTGGVITSAGIVLAATFLVLGVLPLVFLREIGFAVALGVLLDTFVIRSLLVPALSYDIGKRIWWPSKLAKQDDPELTPEEALEPDLPVLDEGELVGATAGSTENRPPAD